MAFARLTGLALGSLALTAIACGDLNSKATLPNATVPFSVYPISAAPNNASTAFSLLGGARVADGSYTFDIAFDRDTAGLTRVYPVRTLAGSLVRQPKRVGLQVVPGSFDGVLDAPSAGYDTLGFKSIRVNDVLVVELQDFDACRFSTRGFFIYAKLTIDSISATSRRIHGNSVINRSCGFRDLTPDVVPTK